MITLDEFLKTDEQRLEEDCKKILSVLKLNQGSVTVQGARWQKILENGSEKWCPDNRTSEYFGLDPVRLHDAMLLLRKRGLLRYGHVDNRPQTGKCYFWFRFTPSYRKALVCEITV